MKLRRLGIMAAALAMLSGCAAFLDSIKVKDVAGVLTSSGGSSAPDGGRDLWLLEYSLVEPLVVRPYLEPVKVAACWQKWASSPGATGMLLAIGKRREEVPEQTLRTDGGPAAQARMGRDMLCDGVDGGPPATAAPFFDCAISTSADLSEALSCELGAADRRLLAYSVLQVADAITGQQASMWPGQPPAVPTGNYARYLAAIATALGDASNLLVATPESRRGEIGTLPALALSGGAANGAFLAGFVYRLLSIREQAYAAATPEQQHRMTSHERFGGIVSTSVGSLIGPVMDLYFDDVRSDPTTPVLPKHALLTCLDAPLLSGEDVPKERAVQACALRLLRKYFTRTHDWHLLCIENASVRQLIGFENPSTPVANAMAFDPLRDLTLKPFFETFGSHLLSNDLVFEQMAVDVEQRVALALDERACAALPEKDQAACLRDNTLASMVEPFLARHISAVYPVVRSTGARAIGGQWLDGGLRSGTPARRALQLTEWPLELRGRTAVLAVSTHRAQGTPTSLRDTLPALAFDTVGTFADQMRAWELNFTGAVAEVERQEIAVWTPPTATTVEPVASTPSSEVRLTPPTSRPVSTAAYPMIPASGGLVDSVVMPENVSFGEPIASATLGEYSFDPVVMTQMFVEGEMMAIQELDKRLASLGWYRVRRFYLEHQATIDAEVRARWEKVKHGPADPQAYAKQSDDRRSKCLAVCTKGGGTFPKQSDTCAETLPNQLIDDGSPRLPW